MSKLGGGLGPMLLGGLGLAAIIVLLLPRPVEDPVDVDLQAVETPRPAQRGEALRLAVAPVWAPERLVDEYQHLADYLGARLGRPVRLLLRQTYGEVNELLRCGSVQVAIICTGAYLDCRQNQIPVDVVASPVCQGKSTYRSLFVVRTGSDLKKVGDLAGHSFAFSDPLSFTGHYYPLWVLIEEGFDPRTFFSRTTFTHGHDASIHAVMDGTVDAAAVDSLVYDFELAAHPVVGDNLRVIHASEPMPICPVVAPRSIDAALLEALRRAFLDMNESPEGRRILASLRIDRFAPPAASENDPALAIYNRVREFLETR